MDLRQNGLPRPLVGGTVISAVVALLVALAASCLPGAAKPGPGPSAAQRTRVPVRPPASAGSRTPVTPPGYSPVKPVIDGWFADPMAIKVGGRYYAYGTNNGDATMPVATAPSPAGPWTRSPGDGLARLPSWAEAGRTWAPEVVPPPSGSGTYVLYFSAARRDRDVQCIGVATSTSPAGPFVPVDGPPLVCPLDLGGAIDPSSYIETDGTRYLLYKSDERRTAAIYLVPLTADGLHVNGPAKRILGHDGSEPVLVEAPDLVRRGGEYVLLYSAGWYFRSDYQTRYAVATSLEGPYRKAPRPLQSTGAYGGAVEGPGSADILSDETGDHLVFHGILKHHGGSTVDRGMFVAPLGWDGSRPVVRGVPARFEAERGRLNGCVATLRRPQASGGSAVGPFDRDGCRLDVPVFAPAAGRYSVRIGYANRSGGAAHLELSVNGVADATFPLRETKDADWTSGTVDAVLNAGWNTLSLARIDGQGQVDYLEIR
ncbi:family 43 glycosylhydrolase [Actinomadura nitritigenes]|uniref:Family 43 glycosylhydrolase n=1 Tax=Actinomadura nitritigenes TaxID=134602 RepID=A0ABS3RCR4_9ACTN|nr:family 43 glycosylhydrolase [Actinomadura nitritigenes]MBO2444026.1 family 43 glycosylhydrolase [Actinomadura nitritigenes]